jgi:osmotically inducible protein OsmC
VAGIRRHAKAHWQGTGKDGTGTLTTQSGTLKATPYGFTSRFGDGQGTNPEELIAAAHAGCFTMALALKLQGAGLIPESLATEAKLVMEQDGPGWKIASVALALRATVPGATPEQFQALAADAKATCPVSRVLNAEITLDATLD